jgi:hypothetical protein
MYGTAGSQAGAAATVGGVDCGCAGWAMAALANSKANRTAIHFIGENDTLMPMLEKL